MKFLCIPCDEVMSFAERQLPGDGTMAAVFTCPGCAREMALLTNPMETQLVSGLGIKVGGRTVPVQPLELTVTAMAEGRPDAFAEGDSGEGEDALVNAATGGGRALNATASDGSAESTRPAGRVNWSDDARARLDNVPSFVRGMVKRIYTDYARENGIVDITPAVMDRARSDLGLEGM